MRENCDLDISFTSRDCFVHKREKVTVYLNFDDDKNIDINLEQEKLEEHIDSLLPRNSGWFFSSSRQYALERKRNCFKVKNIVEFISRRDHSVLM